MGRTSRRTGKEAAPMATVAKEDMFLTAIYARLSVENSGKDDDGAALENQIEVCKEYVKDCPDLQLVRVFQDNGWTGTVMKRPAFDEMMEEVKRGKIQAIVVRDLSRFGRNYIETGTYLERIFPRLGVRFIAVKEQFDTFRVDGSSESLMIPLQNLINDLYSKDISRKVETALHSQMAEGTYAWRWIPYGYRWNEGHTNIVPDEVKAPIVRQIFEWTAQGMSRRTVAEKLEAMDAPKYCERDDKKPHFWSGSTVYGILVNPAYIGTRVSGQYHSALYKGIKREKMPEEKWYVREKAHEPIVSEELFYTVEKMRKENAQKRHRSMAGTAEARAGIIDLFEKKIVCGDCGYRMYFHRARMDSKSRRWYAEYYCSSSQVRRHLGCSSHRILQDSLNEKVFEAIRMHIRIALDYDKLIGEYRESGKVDVIRKGLDGDVKKLSAKVKTVQGKRTKLYEDYVSGILSEVEYVYAKKAYEKEYESINRDLEILIGKRREFLEDVSPENRWVRLMEGIKDSKQLTKELVDAVVEQVRVYEHGAVDVVMKYQDIFLQTGRYLEELQGVGCS